MFYWLMKNLVVGPILKTAFRPWVTGHENIPRSGGVILASNHLSFIDSVFLPLVMDRRITFLAKSDYYTARGPKGWFIKTFLKAAGMIPIDRSGGKASEASLNTGLQVLGRGELLGIYPEGTRSPDGKLYRGRTGIARMALEAKVPVIPVVMVDTDRAMPIGRKVPRIVRKGIPDLEVDAIWAFYGVVTPRLVKVTKAAGVKLNVWTIDDPKIIDRMLEMGADGIVSNDPSLLNR